jgi:aminoglycoside phosphotransferase (APT) family kinase protein
MVNSLDIRWNTIYPSLLFLYNRLVSLGLFSVTLKSMSDPQSDDIAQAATISRLEDYNGIFDKLGGGEMNDTFILDCGTKKAILRIAKHASTTTLQREADALRLLNLEQVPKLIFFDETKRIKDRLWIMESCVDGQSVGSLNLDQYKSFGKLLARVHKIVQSQAVEIDFWEEFLHDCVSFGNESYLLNHPDAELSELIHKAHGYFRAQKAKFGVIRKALAHGDATLSNVLVKDDEVALIDWELSRFKDPMADFATIYYPDMEYNKGRWRVHIKEGEQAALFEGYRQAGGIIDKRRGLYGSISIS